MNYLNRIKNIERNLYKPAGNFSELFSDHFKYSGKPFQDFEEMKKFFNIIEEPPYWTTKELLAFIQKGIMSLESDIGQELLKLASEEMKEAL